MFRIRIDTGGTFTDCVVFNTNERILKRYKKPSTPKKGPIGKVKYGRALEVGFAAKGRLLGLEMMGGGGVGNPLERDPDLVLEDVINEICINRRRKKRLWRNNKH